MLAIIYFTLFFTIYGNTLAEFFSAQSELESLIESHKKVIDDLQNYIHKEQQRLSYLKRYLNTYKKEHAKAIKDISTYLGNPINAFKLIKRLTIDITDLDRNIVLATVHAMNKPPFYHKNLKYPTTVDLEGAAIAIARLQKVYKLNARELSEGKLNGVYDSSAMTASDCYELGHALMINHTETALEWMKETLRKYKKENVTYHFSEIDIMDYISLAYYLSGNRKTAIEWIHKVIEMGFFPPAKDNFRYGNIPLEKIKEMEQLENNNYTSDRSITEQVMMKLYEGLCRSEINIAVDVANRLTCSYYKENPYLKIAPLKMEMLYLNPDVLLFHDVMSDSEMETIKEISKPRLHRSYVLTGESNSTVADYRVSKVAWLRDNESDIIASLTRRIEYMTGLSMETAEDLQVINYGIGGHYEPHYDFVPVNTRINLDEGNRIATVMFYMSDVAQGGATVFPWLGLSMKPVKGAAVYWRNLHASGEVNIITLHAGCPVLQGSKWVVNKWLHLRGQEFLSPCNLEYEDDDHEIIPEHILDAAFSFSIFNKKTDRN